MADDVREMGMEHKGEISQRFSHEVLHAKARCSRREKIRLWEVDKLISYYKEQK
jgi:hypothetical protein